IHLLLAGLVIGAQLHHVRSVEVICMSSGKESLGRPSCSSSSRRCLEALYLAGRGIMASATLGYLRKDPREPALRLTSGRTNPRGLVPTKRNFSKPAFSASSITMPPDSPIAPSTKGTPSIWRIGIINGSVEDARTRTKRSSTWLISSRVHTTVSPVRALTAERLSGVGLLEKVSKSKGRS